MSDVSHLRPKRAWIVGGAGWLVVAAYLAQHLRIAENPVDGGLILGYIQSLADGDRWFHDVLDSYGVANWPLPVLAYELAGQKVLGVRVLLWLEKLLAVGLGYGLIRRLSDRFHAWLTVAWMTLLLGLPWSYLHSAYPFIPLTVIQLAAWWLLLLEPLRRRSLNIGIAGLLTGIALSTKLNAGAFLLAGGIFHCLYFWRPGPEAGGTSGRIFHAVRWLGLLCYLVVFCLFIWPHFGALYLVYLVVPLLLLVGWASPAIEPRASPRAHLSTCALYTGTSIGTAFCILAAAIGPAALGDYFRMTRGILSRVAYSSEFPALGVPTELLGFNEHYWPQLPWLGSMACVTLLALRWRNGAGPSIDARRLGSLWALYTFQLFVLYSRPDNAHVLPAMILAVPVLFVLLHRIGERLWPTRRVQPRVVLAMLVGAGYLSIGTLASWDALFAPGDWHSSRLMGLRNQVADAPGLQPHLEFNRQTLAAMCDAARFVDSITDDGERMLLLNRSEILLFASNTRPATGRYRHLFYLISNSLFRRADFDAVAPPQMLAELLRDPPPVLFTSYGLTALRREFPELARLLETRYELRRAFGHYLVYTRRESSTPRAGELVE